MKLKSVLIGLVSVCLTMSMPAFADTKPVPAKPLGSSANSTPQEFKTDELVSSGHKFFGNISQGLASAIEAAVKRWGQPNGYILGQEAAGAFVGGLRYGEGTLYTRNAGDRAVFWQGPTVGFDFGGEGDFRPLRRHRRLGLFCRRLQCDGVDVRQYRRCSNRRRRRCPPRGEFRLSEIH